ncbi:MAG TPA: GIY-YIG nuclease family protein, partial [Lachnospiraceae bacterium]|nr:GIY-YIG nuclease family protein [Lachnospiraceae bacterium]
MTNNNKINNDNKFIVSTKKFHSSYYGPDKHLVNWPMLYLLENKKEAYIGQTASINRRMAEHKRNSQKENFETAYFIDSSEFNQSVTLNYESKLIQLYAADNNKKLINGNDGIRDVDYFKKDYYDKEFKELWNTLLEKKIVKNKIEDIENSDMYK